MHADRRACVCPPEPYNKLRSAANNEGRKTSDGQDGWHARAASLLLPGACRGSYLGGIFLLHVNALIAALAYVLAVLVVAARWGLLESFATSIAAMLCLNYFFLPPILSLTIADPQNWVALFVFMVTAVTASQLSARVRNKAAEAQARTVEVERLYQRLKSVGNLDQKNSTDEK